MLAYCVMPNHVHVLLIPIEPQLRERDGIEHATVHSLAAPEDDPIEQPDAHSPLSSIMHSLKSYTANQANALLRRSGTFWQTESYDHWVRDDDELERIVAYINANPVKAGLVAAPHEWFFSSAHDRYVYDGETCGFLADVGDAASVTKP